MPEFSPYFALNYMKTREITMRLRQEMPRFRKRGLRSGSFDNRLPTPEVRRFILEKLLARLQKGPVANS